MDLERAEGCNAGWTAQFIRTVHAPSSCSLRTPCTPKDQEVHIQPSSRTAFAICLNRAEGSQNGLIAALGTLGIFDLPFWGYGFVSGYACGDVSANCNERAGEEKWRTCQDELRNLGRLDCDRVLWSFDLTCIMQSSLKCLYG
jgi:hypothetical protein